MLNCNCLWKLTADERAELGVTAVIHAASDPTINCPYISIRQRRVLVDMTEALSEKLSAVSVAALTGYILCKHLEVGEQY